MSAEENKAMLRRLLEAINTGNMDVVDELFTSELAGQAKQGSPRFALPSPTDTKRWWT